MLVFRPTPAPTSSVLWSRVYTISGFGESSHVPGIGEFDKNCASAKFYFSQTPLREFTALRRAQLAARRERERREGETEVGFAFLFDGEFYLRTADHNLKLGSGLWLGLGHIRSDLWPASQWSLVLEL